MTDPRHKEDMSEHAALYALEALGDDEQRQFKQALETAPPEVWQQVAAFQEVVQELAFSGPAISLRRHSRPSSWRASRRNRRSDPAEERSRLFDRGRGVARPGFWCVYETAVQRFGRSTGHDAAAVGSGWNTGGAPSPAGRRVLRVGRNCICAGEFLQAGTTIAPRPGASIPSHQAKRAAWPW